MAFIQRGKANDTMEIVFSMIHVGFLSLCKLQQQFL